MRTWRGERLGDIMKILFLVAALAVAFSGKAGASELVVGGNFESPVVGGPSYLLDVTPTGWVGTGDLTGQGYAGAVSSGNGNQWLDLNPDVSAGTGISQSIHVTAGTTYDFSFLYNGGGGTNGVGATTQISFLISGILSGNVSTAALNVYNGSPWQSYSYVFTPITSANVTLSFLPNGVWFGGFIDDVSVASASPTPLPAALPLFASGLGAMAFLARRRKQKNAAALAA